MYSAMPAHVCDVGHQDMERFDRNLTTSVVKRDARSDRMGHSRGWLAGYICQLDSFEGLVRKIISADLRDDGPNDTLKFKYDACPCFENRIRVKFSSRNCGCRPNDVLVQAGCSCWLRYCIRGGC